MAAGLSASVPCMDGSQQQLGRGGSKPELAATRAGQQTASDLRTVQQARGEECSWRLQCCCGERDRDQKSRLRLAKHGAGQLMSTHAPRPEPSARGNLFNRGTRVSKNPSSGGYLQLIWAP